MRSYYDDGSILYASRPCYIDREKYNPDRDIYQLRRTYKGNDNNNAHYCIIVTYYSVLAIMGVGVGEGEKGTWHHDESL